MNLFKIQNLDRRWWELILWWEIRRFLFIILIIILHIISLKILGFNPVNIEMGTGEYFIFLIYFFLALILNLIYTFGWIIELFIRRSLSYAPKFFLYVSILSIICHLVLTVYFKNKL